MPHHMSFFLQCRGRKQKLFSLHCDKCDCLHARVVNQDALVERHLTDARAQRWSRISHRATGRAARTAKDPPGETYPRPQRCTS